jgi:hypothetical protein
LLLGRSPTWEEVLAVADAESRALLEKG